MNKGANAQKSDINNRFGKAKTKALHKSLISGDLYASSAPLILLQFLHSLLSF
jgi:hypothetical protein